MTTTMEAPKTQKTSPQATAQTPKRWFAVRRNQALLAGALLAAIALVTWFVIVSGMRKEQFASRDLAQARAAAEAGNFPLASSQLQRIISTYGGSDAAKEAAIALNQVRMINGQNQLAVVGLQDFLKQNSKTKFAPPAYGLLGQALENAGKPLDAAGAYSAASRVADVDYLRAEYLLAAARAYLAAGKRQEAEEALRKITKDYSRTPSNTEAAIRLAELTKGKM